jgi:hypothetical protein
MPGRARLRRRGAHITRRCRARAARPDVDALIRKLAAIGSCAARALVVPSQPPFSSGDKNDAATDDLVRAGGSGGGRWVVVGVVVLLSADILSAHTALTALPNIGANNV